MPFLILLEKLLPAGIVALIGIALFIAKDMYEKKIKYERENKEDLRQEKENLKQYFREQKEEIKSSYEKQIEAQRQTYELLLRELRDQKTDLTQVNRELNTDNRVHLEKVVTLSKELTEVYESLRERFKSISSDVGSLPIDESKKKQLQSEIKHVYSSSVHRLEGLSKSALSEINSLSKNRESIAKQAAKRAREKKALRSSKDYDE